MRGYVIGGIFGLATALAITGLAQNPFYDAPAGGGGGPGSDTTAVHTDTAAEISAVAEKTVPVSADLLLIEDSAAANAKKRVQIGNLPSPAAGLTQGSVLFMDAGGIITEDNTNFFWDASAVRLGIGIAVPAGRFHVSTTGNTTALVVDNSTGFVGAGTSTPDDQLDVAGALRLTLNTTFVSGAGPRLYKDASLGFTFQAGTGSASDLTWATSDGQIILEIPTGTNDLFLQPTSSGLVGIGSIIPDSALTVGRTRVGGAGNNLSQIMIGGTITEASTGTHEVIAGIHIPVRTVVDGGGSEIVTTLTSLYIAGAPVPGTTPIKGPFAFFVDGGDSRIRGAVEIGPGALAKAALSAGDISFDSGGSTSPSVKFYTAANNNFGIEATVADGLRFIEDLDEAGAAVRMSIDAGGNVGIGTTTPGSPLDIAATTSSMKQTRWSDNADSGAGIVIQRSRGAFVGDDTVVQLGDKLVSLNFRAYDGSDFLSQAATIQVFVDGTPGVNDLPGRLVFGTTASGASTSTERMRISAAGNVGIGNISPDELLHAAKAVDGVSVLTLLENSQANASTSTNETAELRFGFGGNNDVARIVAGKLGDYTITANEDSFLAFYTDLNGTDAERLRIDSDTMDINVDVGIGAATIDELFHIAESVDGVSILALLENSQPNTGGSTNEAAEIRFGFGGNNDVARISVTKKSDYTVLADEDSAMRFWVDINGTATQIVSLLNSGLLLMPPASKLDFNGAAGGGAQGIRYKDAGGTLRSAMAFPGSDVVVLSNQAANGTVEIRANTSTAGSGGEVTVVTFEDDGIAATVPVTASNLKTHTLIEDRAPVESTASDTFVTLASSASTTFSGRPVLCFVNVPMFPSVANTGVILAIQIDSGSDVEAARFLLQETEHSPVLGQVIVTPSAGSHTINLRWRRNGGTGTLTLDTNDQILVHAVEL